jgi:CRISPR system Cascade subunit CasC
LIIELHLLQSFPVSNLNRDDVGQPKTATFGGCTRGRISSQSLKKAARDLFTVYGLAPDELGFRTKRLVERAAQRLAEAGRPADAVIDISAAGLETLGFGVKADTRFSEYLLYVGPQAIDLLATFCEDNWDRLAAAVATAKKDGAKKKTAAARSGADLGSVDEADDDTGATPRGRDRKATKIKPDKVALAAAAEIFDARRVADIALFGRMIANKKEFSVSGASQVAHALSTHAVANEYDFYTAMDHLKSDDTPGADMMGTIDFNTACYYRYANLDLEQLTKNLDGDTDLVGRATRAWLLAFVHAVPTGKQNSMAASTRPETLLAVVRERGAWNLANAFLRPVTEPDIMVASTERLLRHFSELRRFYDDTDLRAVTGASVTGEIPHLPDAEIATGVREFTERVLAGGLPTTSLSHG